jgi:ribonuclease P protein component
VADAARGEDSPRRRLPRARRITAGNEIRALIQRGKRSRTAHLDVFDSASPLSYPRVGVIVPKHKQSIIRRNRLKRQLREILRLELLPRMERAQVARSVLLRARREAYGASYGELRTELLSWAEARWSHGSFLE